MSNVIEAMAATLFDAADAPALRAEIAELKATVTRLTAQVERLERENKRLAADAEFHYQGLKQAQLTIAEYVMGLKGRG